MYGIAYKRAQYVSLRDDPRISSMAARKMRVRHQDEVRAKIQASCLIDRLHKHAKGEVEMSATQVQAAKILLDKAVSNAPTEISGPGGEPFVLHLAQTDAAL